MEAFVFNFHPYVPSSVTREPLNINSPCFSLNQVTLSSFSSNKKKTRTRRSPTLSMAESAQNQGEVSCDTAHFLAARHLFTVQSQIKMQFPVLSAI